MSDERVSRTSLTLLDRVRRKDQEAWDRLVSLYAPLVLHWCLRAGLQAADAEDAVQDVFLAVARHIGDFRHDRDGDTFRGWLRTIMRNRLRDRAAQRGEVAAGGSEARDQLAQVPSPSEEDSEDGEVNLVYRRAVELVESEFEPRTRRAFWLMVSGRRAAEVAAELEMSVGAVHTARSRVLKRLREEFAGLLDCDGEAPPEEDT